MIKSIVSIVFVVVFLGNSISSFAEEVPPPPCKPSGDDVSRRQFISSDEADGQICPIFDIAKVCTRKDNTVPVVEYACAGSDFQPEAHITCVNEEKSMVFCDAWPKELNNKFKYTYTFNGALEPAYESTGSEIFINCPGGKTGQLTVTVTTPAGLKDDFTKSITCPKD